MDERMMEVFEEMTASVVDLISETVVPDTNKNNVEWVVF